MFMFMFMFMFKRIRYVPHHYRRFFHSYSTNNLRYLCSHSPVRTSQTETVLSVEAEDSLVPFLHQLIEQTGCTCAEIKFYVYSVVKNFPRYRRKPPFPANIFKHFFKLFESSYCFLKKT